jgi:hypothetical protein
MLNFAPFAGPRQKMTNALDHKGSRALINPQTDPSLFVYCFTARIAQAAKLAFFSLTGLERECKNV